MPARSPDALRRAWLCLGGLLVLYVTWQSLVPQPFTEGMGSDKFQHLSTYALLGWWFGCAVGTGGWERRLLVALGVVALGTGIEALQFLMPPREASLLDALANVVGVMLGTVLATVPAMDGLAIVRRVMGGPGRC